MASKAPDSAVYHVHLAGHLRFSLKTDCLLCLPNGTTPDRYKKLMQRFRKHVVPTRPSAPMCLGGWLWAMIDLVARNERGVPPLSTKRRDCHWRFCHLSTKHSRLVSYNRSEEHLCWSYAFLTTPSGTEI
ncbi:unnamed protein product [Ectocarpus fasciculatus]